MGERGPFRAQPFRIIDYARLGKKSAILSRECVCTRSAFVPCQCVPPLSLSLFSEWHKTLARRHQFLTCFPGMFMLVLEQGPAEANEGGCNHASIPNAPYLSIYPLFRFGNHRDRLGRDSFIWSGLCFLQLQYTATEKERIHLKYGLPRWKWITHSFFVFPFSSSKTFFGGGKNCAL